MNPQPDPSTRIDWYLDHITADAERFAGVLDTSPLEMPVPSCPGWTLGRLAEHMGQVHRWARFCAEHGRTPTVEESEPLETLDVTRPAGWIRDGAAALVATLRDIDPAAPSWHPWPVEQVAAFWPRRQAHETAVHRWDAERAADAAAPIDAEFAGDGIDEYFEAVIPRLLAKGAQLPTGSFHVHCTDVEGEWLVWNEGGEYRMIREHRKGDAALRGPANAILLRLWGRQSDLENELSPVGDDTVLAAWTDIGGV